MARKHHEPKPIRRTVNLRRNRMTTVSGLQPSDRVTPVYDPVDGWRVEIESDNGVVIEHIRLTQPANKV